MTDAKGKEIDLEQEKRELLRIHAQDRQAHFETDAGLLLDHAAEEFISVSDGAITRSTRADVGEMFKTYFKNVTYYEWDDLEPPVISVSDDASIAWMIVRTRVHRVQVDESGAEHERKFVYAGIMTYARQAEKWVRTANVSTFVPTAEL